MLTGLLDLRSSNSSSGGENDHTCSCLVSVEVEHARRSETNLHDSLAASACHDHGLLLFEDNPPDRLSWLAKFTHLSTSLEIPDLDAAIAAARDNAGVVELQAGDAVVVRR